MELIVGNLKMNLLSAAERKKYLDSFKKEMKGNDLHVSQIVLCPPAPHLETFVKELKGKTLSIGAQNVFWENQGSYTGEVSAAMVKNFGAEYSIIGHSERRRYFAETDSMANAKIKSALENGLKPIYCVGETKEEREVGDTAQIITSQLREGLADITDTKAADLVIAYEPVWAVGSDAVPTSDEILEVKILIKKILTEKFGASLAQEIRILYGGSVKESLMRQVCLEPGMDGVLVGRESLTPKEFIKIAKTASDN